MNTQFPPPVEDQITLANWRTRPFNKWAFHHVREIVPSAEIKHDPTRIRALAQGSEVSMSTLTVDGQAFDFEEYLTSTNTDGLVVLHQGKLAHQTFCSGMTANDPHILMSISKSMLGLLAGILAAKGILNLNAEATSYVPELDSTAFAGAKVHDLLDMRTGITFNEDYLALEGAIIEYRKSTNWDPLGPGQAATDLRSFFLTLKECDGPHGGNFDYKSPCTDLLGWIIERAAGKRYADLFSEYFWSKLGAENPGYITVDRLGAPRCAGGICLTTRDLARVGQLMVEGGAGIVPEAWIDDIETAGDPEAWRAGSMNEFFPKDAMHYRSKWYVFRDRGPILMCLGIHGQNLFVDRKSELVLARHGSAPLPIDIESERKTLALFEALRDHVA